MGVVYRAAEAGLERSVALKVILPELAQEPGFRELFIRESTTAAALEHPNVIPVYRAGEDAGHLYIAMRFVEGESLGLLIARSGRLPPGRAARLVAQVADALDAAHERGLVHRDVKPANVMIADPDGEEHAYLTDFGLSIRGARGTGRDAGALGGDARIPGAGADRRAAHRPAHRRLRAGLHAVSRADRPRPVQRARRRRSPHGAPDRPSAPGVRASPPGSREASTRWCAGPWPSARTTATRRPGSWAAPPSPCATTCTSATRPATRRRPRPSPRRWTPRAWSPGSPPDAPCREARRRARPSRGSGRPAPARSWWGRAGWATGPGTSWPPPGRSRPGSGASGWWPCCCPELRSRSIRAWRSWPRRRGWTCAPVSATPTACAT